MSEYFKPGALVKNKYTKNTYLVCEGGWVRLGENEYTAHREFSFSKDAYDEVFITEEKPVEIFGSCEVVEHINTGDRYAIGDNGYLNLQNGQFYHTDHSIFDSEYHRLVSRGE